MEDTAMAEAKAKDADGTANEVRQVGRPFKSGSEWSGNRAGRPKGSRNKLGEDFLTKLQADFAEHGEKTIQQVREERPHEYLKVVASILPKELNVRSDALTEMSDEDLAAILGAVQSAILAGVYTQAGSGDEAPSRH